LTRAEQERRRDLLSLLYLPWALLVVAPVVVLSMITLGSLAVVVAWFSARTAFWVGVAWCRLALLVNLTRVELRGVEHARSDQGYVIVLNHLSHADVGAFYGWAPLQFRWVLKEELRRVPGLGWYCQAGGHIFVDRKNPARAIASLNAARERLQKEQMSVAIFAEGTRSLDGRLQPFKKGGFVMAQQLGLPILPVSVSGSAMVQPARRLRLLPGRILLTVHPPIPPPAPGEEGLRQVMEQTRQAIRQGLNEWERGD